MTKRALPVNNDGAVVCAKGRWHVYLLRCADESLYCGITNELQARILAHNQGRGAKYTRSRLPVVLAYVETADNHSAALRREYQIKRLSKTRKEALCRRQESPGPDV